MAIRPRIYVGTYAKYNNGSLKGAWLDLTDYSDKEEFYEACYELHSDESDPEFMFQDYEDCCGYASECGLDETIFDLLNRPEDEQEIISLYLDQINSSVDFDSIIDLFQGTASTTADFAEQLAIDCGDIPRDLPSWIEYAIDWEAAWNCSLSFDYDTAYANGEYYFFHH